jgi:hypothetical protein
MSTITSITYFAKDGNYGDAAGVTIIDTSDWTDSDFEMLDSITDEFRPLAARMISEWIEGGREDTERLHYLLDNIPLT